MADEKRKEVEASMADSMPKSFPSWSEVGQDVGRMLLAQPVAQPVQIRNSRTSEVNEETPQDGRPLGPTNSKNSDV